MVSQGDSQVRGCGDGQPSGTVLAGTPVKSVIADAEVRDAHIPDRFEPDRGVLNRGGPVGVRNDAGPQSQRRGHPEALQQQGIV
jgi:hypothetical protein